MEGEIEVGAMAAAIRAIGPERVAGLAFSYDGEGASQKLRQLFAAGALPVEVVTEEMLTSLGSAEHTYATLQELAATAHHCCDDDIMVLPNLSANFLTVLAQS